MSIDQDGVNDLDFVYDGGLSYAKELEDDLRRKVFEKQLFLDLVKGIISHSKSKKYSDDLLKDAKTKALKLLYRILFILYAESRLLLPITHTKYKDISFGALRERLTGLEKEPDSILAWEALSILFSSISNGNPAANVPQYNGALFEFDESLDSLKIKNRHLIAALKDLTEIDGKGIDYQNFGVRQLGSLYEGLLDYTVKQAPNDLAIVKDEILDFSFAADLKTKPSRIIERGDLYLNVAGLARKGTGSYYTPEKIVKFLVLKGLQPIFEDRETSFIDAIKKWRKTKDNSDAALSTNHLLDIQVVDPAMGSGHFLVVAVDEITKWIMSLLQRFPDAPLAEEIGKDREGIIAEQNKKGITLGDELLSFNVILKRKVMKRCVFGVDVNPLAVELAKLSLWLDSFTIGTPLTFLDHHIRCGDSIMGLWIKNLKSKNMKNLTLDLWTRNVEYMGNELQQISLPADLTLGDFRRNKESYAEFREKSKPLRFLLDMVTSGIIDKKLKEILPKNFSLVEESIRQNKLKQASWYKSVSQSISYSERYRFFHWELEFPDAFADKRKGFDLIVTNPPWDAIQPYDDDFFSEYHPGFRKIVIKSEKDKIKKRILKDTIIERKFFDYVQSVKDRLAFYRLSGEYVMHGSENPDTWKAFVERIFKLLDNNGCVSILLPSGIITNKGAKELRQVLLEKNIQYFYEFENAKGIFPEVHRSYKFVLLVFDNRKSKGEFEAAFYLHNIDSLVNKREEGRKFVKLNKPLIEMTSPENLVIPECRYQQDVEILKLVYSKHKVLEDKNKDWTVTLIEEFREEFREERLVAYALL